MPRVSTVPAVGCVMPAENLEQGALAGAVLADQTQSLAALEREADIAQGVEVSVSRPPGHRLE